MYLNNHSYFSMRYGVIPEEELLAMAQENDLTHFALTDINNTTACLNFIRKASKYSITPVVGIDFRNNAQQCYVGMAKNNAGFLELNNYLSKHLHTGSPFPETAPLFENCYIIYPFERLLELNKTTFSANEYIGIRPEDIHKLRFSELSVFTKKLVVLYSVSFRGKRDYNIHRLLRAIDTNTLLSKLPEAAQGKSAHKMLPKEELRAIFADFPHIIENSQRLIASCKIHFDFSTQRKNQNLQTLFGSTAADFEKLEQLCHKGLPERYSLVNDTIKKRLAKELALIRQQNFVSFFLINWKIIEYARSKGYFHVGRGSGANSIVAYLLRITDVDPIELDLYFERFMNLYRASPPDFDIDFSTWDREDVTRYIFEEFGKNGQAALLGSVVTFKHSGAVRELGKVFGLPKYEIDKLSKGKYDPNKVDKITRLVLRYARYFEGRPNYISIHAGGILIAEKPIHYYSATNLPPKGFPTVQFDMHIAEDVGLYKFDILGQRGLGKIKDTVSIIKENYPEIQLPDIHNAKDFFEDPDINAMIARADCIGCFYVESPAMRMLLKKLAVNNYLTLVAASSIIRPGVAHSGMMREYILRHRYPERRKEAHPVLWEIMPDTYGVMVYQEDVIKVAHHYAGLDLGEADVLRRGMSGKYRSREEFQAVKDKFKSNCIARGEAPEIVDDVWRQIESFAGYAFAKGHSASYAVESYQSLYLKCNFPLEYMVATINNGGGFYSVEIYVHEIKMKGGCVVLPCINTSGIATTIQNKVVYLGFQHLKALEKKTMLGILQARAEGNFTSLDNFMERVAISIEQLEILIRIDAFRGFNSTKQTLLWQAHYKYTKITTKDKFPEQQQLFASAYKSFELPSFKSDQLENAFDELELLEFTLYDPFLLLKNPPTSNLLNADLAHYLGKTITIYGYVVTIKNTKTKKGLPMNFGTFLDRAGNWIDTVLFPPIAKKYPFQGKGIYRITGKVVSEFDFLTVEVISQHRMPYIADPRFSG